MKTEKYELPSFWASALVNNDPSGLSDEDEKALDAWVKKHKPGHCVDVSEEGFFKRYHDAWQYVLPCDCSEYTFIQED